MWLRSCIDLNVGGGVNPALRQNLKTRPFVVGFLFGKFFVPDQLYLYFEPNLTNVRLCHLDIQHIKLVNKLFKAFIPRASFAGKIQVNFRKLGDVTGI